MPNSDPVARRAYHRRWIAKRRAEYFAGKSCAKCGSTLDMELDHIDPSTKVSHAIWSWSKERREAELAKCQVLCGECHKAKSQQESRKTCDNPDLSWCYKCKQWRHYAMFDRNRARWNGLAKICKACKSASDTRLSHARKSGSEPFRRTSTRQQRSGDSRM